MGFNSGFKGLIETNIKLPLLVSLLTNLTSRFG